MGCVYILECADGSYYVGSTRNLAARLSDHQSGRGAKYTAKRLPIKLVFAEEFASIAEAYELEKQIQGWSRAKREALIAGNWEDLADRSRKKWRKGTR